MQGTGVVKGEKCHVCDRYPGMENDPHPDGECPARGGESCVCESLCWGDEQCRDAAVDWRARALRAEAELAERGPA